MKKFITKYLKYIVLAAAFISMAWGIYRGELETVFHKAAAICMECIGIG